MSPAKFLFDQDFAAAAKVKPAIPLEQHRAQLHEADATGYMRGFATAKAEILAEAEQRSGRRSSALPPRSPASRKASRRSRPSSRPRRSRSP